MNLTLALPERVTHAQARGVADGLIAVARTQPGPMVLDASALRVFDTSALAVILACQRAALARDTSLVVLGLPERAQALARVYGVAALFASEPAPH